MQKSKIIRNLIYIYICIVKVSYRIFCLVKYRKKFNMWQNIIAINFGLIHRDKLIIYFIYLTYIYIFYTKTLRISPLNLKKIDSRFIKELLYHCTIKNIISPIIYILYQIKSALYNAIKNFSRQSDNLTMHLFKKEKYIKLHTMLIY